MARCRLPTSESTFRSFRARAAVAAQLDRWRFLQSESLCRVELESSMPITRPGVKAQGRMAGRLSVPYVIQKRRMAYGQLSVRISPRFEPSLRGVTYTPVSAALTLLQT